MLYTLKSSFDFGIFHRKSVELYRTFVKFCPKRLEFNGSSVNLIEILTPKSTKRFKCIRLPLNSEEKLALILRSMNPYKMCQTDDIHRLRTVEQIRILANWDGKSNKTLFTHEQFSFFSSTRSLVRLFQ